MGIEDFGMTHVVVQGSFRLCKLSRNKNNYTTIIELSLSPIFKGHSLLCSEKTEIMLGV